MPASQDEKSKSLDLMFQEALQAAQGGNRARARDLLTRLLKARQDRVDYWVWMSAVVDTPKERVFCLKEALRLDPQNAQAKRGLVILGAIPVEESLVIPVRLQKRSWQALVASPSGQNDAGKRGKLPLYQVILMVAALIVFGELMIFAFWGAQQQKNPRRRLVINLPTSTPTEIGAATMAVTIKAISAQPDPLWMRLDSTYTPTPLYVDTPHPISEAYRIGMRAMEHEDWKNADQFFRQAATEAAKSPEGSVDVLFYVAENARLQGNYSSAAAIYQQVIGLAPEFAPAYLGRAQTWLALDAPDSWDKAFTDMRTALEKDPHYAEAYLELAALYIQKKQPNDALATLERAGDILNNSPLAYLYRGQAYLELSDAEKALANARRANAMDVTLLPAYRVLGEALQAKGDLPGSIEPLQVYLTHEARDPRAWVLFAKAALAKQQPKEALAALNRASRLDNRSLDILLLRGGALLDMQEAEKALADFQTALKLDPESFEASLGVGKALMALNYPGDAWDRLERTQKLARTDLQKAELIFWRGQSLERLGQLEAALRDYQALVNLPKSSAPMEWVEFAQKRISMLTTLTPTAKPRFSTVTPSPTGGLQGGVTPTRTATKKP